MTSELPVAKRANFYPSDFATERIYSVSTYGERATFPCAERDIHPLCCGRKSYYAVARGNRRESRTTSGLGLCTWGN